MDCPKCGEENIGIKYLEPHTIEIRCYCGLHYMYLYNGKWESSQDRMKRMAQKYTCKNCKQEFTTYNEFVKNNPRTLCETCAIKLSRREWIPKAKREKNKSPWRVWVNYKKQV